MYPCVQLEARNKSQEMHKKHGNYFTVLLKILQNISLCLTRKLYLWQDLRQLREGVSEAGQTVRLNSEIVVLTTTAAPA